MSSAPPEAGQWQRIAPYLDQALDLQPAERERWLTDLTATEPEIAGAVRQLLAEHADLQDRGFLANAAVDPARHALLKRAAGVGEQVGAYRLIREIGRGGMFIASRSDAIGDVPGLQSVETAICTPSSRILSIGGSCCSRR